MRTLLFLSLLVGCGTPWRWESLASLRRPTAAEFPDAPAVILLDDVRYESTLPYRSNAIYYERRHVIMSILNEAGFKYAEVVIPMRAADGLRLIKARTLSPDGSVEEVTQEQILAESARDTAEHEGRRSFARKFRLPGVKVGSILEYVYETETDNALWSANERVSSELPSLHHHAEIWVGHNIQFGVKAYNLSTSFRKESKNDLDGVILDVYDIPASRHESFSLPWRLTEPSWVFRMRGYTRGSMTRLAYDRWPDVVKETAKTLYLDNGKYLKGISLKLPSDCGPDKRCVLDQALAWVRDHTSINGFTGSLDSARSMKDVVASGTASNWEKALLLWGTLGESGVAASFALATRDPALMFDHGFPLPDQFDHLLVYVPSQRGIDKDLLVDPSCEECAPGQLPTWLAGPDALLVKANYGADGVTAEAFFVPLAGATPPLSSDHREIEATLDGAGTLTGTLLAERRGQLATDWRLATRKWQAAEWRKHQAAELGARHKAGRIVSTSPDQCDKPTGVCRHSVSWTIPSFAAVDGERLVVPLDLLASRWDHTAIDKERHNNVFMRHQQVDEESVTLRLPDGYVVEELPQPATVQSPALEARLEVSATAGEVTFKRRIETHPGVWDRTRYPSLAVVLQAFAGWRHRTITLRRR
jgi:hypothetical protein